MTVQNSLLQALNRESRTANGAVTLQSSESALVDFFFKASGSTRGQDISAYFTKALDANWVKAVRTLLYCRDCRGGQGERDHFRNLMPIFIGKAEMGYPSGDNALSNAQRNVIDKMMETLIEKTVEVGRYDDLKVFFNTRWENEAVAFWLGSLQNEDLVGLAAKWLPVKAKKGARIFMKATGLNEKDWRQKVVPLRDTVEQKMCAGDWDSIDITKLPSRAAQIYRRAIQKHAPQEIERAAEKVRSGEATMNAGAIYPYSVVQDAVKEAGLTYSWDNYKSLPKNLAHKPAVSTLILSQWENLPNYLGNSKANLLPIIDTSGSMTSTVRNSGPTPMDIALGLGIYISERTQGAFKDVFMTFSEKPELQTMSGNLFDRLGQMNSACWGYNTDLQKVFDVLLSAAKNNKVPEEDMPTHLFIVSDMEFDHATGDWRGRKEPTNFEEIERKYSEAGYKRPNIIFWNVEDCRSDGNFPVKFDQNGTALVSGFSPAIMQDLLEGNLTPEVAMERAIMKDRYDFGVPSE
ncbi:PF11443 domain protein [Pseudoalteromonas phage J2-1_QLiu-2017]|nr:PF11443 domain protein [Pseudoalteromonas phage J2-1_QLiu-2017]